MIVDGDMDARVAIVAVLALVVALAKTSIWAWMLPRLHWIWTRRDGLGHFRAVTFLRPLAVSVLGYWVFAIWIDRALDLGIVPNMSDRAPFDILVVGFAAIACCYGAWVFHKQGH